LEQGVHGFGHAGEVQETAFEVGFFCHVVCSFVKLLFFNEFGISTPCQ
jgi:hypothetical protein